MSIPRIQVVWTNASITDSASRIPEVESHRLRVNQKRISDMSNAKAANMPARAATHPEIGKRLRADPVATFRAEDVSLQEHAGCEVLEGEGGL